MIKNQKQAGATRDKLSEIKNAKAEYNLKNDGANSSIHKLKLKAYDSLIKDLEIQLEKYENLINGNFHCWKPSSLEEISEILISARLAQKLSQKDLGDLVSLKEQQIQRYESSDYETASWPRIIEIAMALKIKFYFEKIILLNDLSFDFPDELTKEKVEKAKEKVKKNGFSLIS